MAKILSSGSLDRNPISNRRLKPNKHDASQTNATAEKSKQLAGPALQGLCIVATPIGNSGDLGHRARDALEHASLIACEDTRITAKLLKIYKIETPTIPYHDHNARRQLPRLMERLKKDELVVLVCDAGTPLISDPGYKLVQACLNAKLPVSTIPGPSAVLAALVLSGFPTDRFFFQGFLANKKGARCAQLRELVSVPGTLVFLESARRLAAMLVDAAEELGDRQGAVCRELTKKFEEVKRGSLKELAAYYAEFGPPKGEVSVVIEPAKTKLRISDKELNKMLVGALKNSSVRDASNDIARITGLSKRKVYSRALVLSKQSN